VERPDLAGVASAAVRRVANLEQGDLLETEAIAEH
jgi:hypothetical protein